MLGAGCATRPTSDTNQSSIVNVDSVSNVEYNGERSSLGYVTFSEKPDIDVVRIEQAILIPGNPCQTVQTDVTPDTGETAGNPVKVEFSMEDSGPQTACPSVLPGDYPSPSAIEVEFESLTAGQTIIVSFYDGELREPYITAGESNTETREPIDLPEGVRVG